MRAPPALATSLLCLAGASALVTAVALAACSEPAAEGCASDADCPAGRRCEADACVAATGGGGAGGSEPVVNECDSSEDCLPAPFAAIPSIYWDGDAADGQPVCTVEPGRCTGSELCLLPTSCRPEQDGATRPGGFLCERADQCLSGRCVPIDGVGVCFRACLTDGDCPEEPATADVPVAGLACRDVVDSGVPLRTCAPRDPALPARTLCATDCDCVAGDGCEAGPLACRFVGTVDGTLGAVPLCDPPLPGASRDAPARCAGDPASCHGGACVTACQEGGRDPKPHFCRSSPLRCTRPCGRDDECPDRTACVTARDGERVGEWLLEFQHDVEPGRDLRYCQLPTGGCFDEQDCCPVPDGNGGCTEGWAQDRQRCAVNLTSASPPRLLTQCVVPLASLAAPGSCCTSHEACDSALCVPARAGTPCAGGGVCSVPCEPDPDPDGVPGSGDERDRCASADFGASTYHLESRCLPFAISVTYSDDRGDPAILQTTLDACQ